MRLLSRQTPVDELDVTSTDLPEQGSLQVPAKAQKILGEKARVSHNGALGRSSQDIKYTDPDAFWGIRDAEEKSLATVRESILHVGSVHGSAADSDTVPGAKKGAALPAVPRAIRPSEDLPQSNESSVPTGTSTVRTGHQNSQESMNREYYEAAKQPLKVSQQTSESSVRDMALRKGSTPLYNSAMESAVFQWPSKAQIMSKFSSKDAKESKESPGEGSKKDKKRDLTSVFPQPKLAGRKSSSSKFGRSSSETGDSFKDFPQDTVHTQLTRQGSKLVTKNNSSKDIVSRDIASQDSTSKPLPEQPKTSSESRIKFFEPDIYDSKNTKVFRPPKGIKNWFDGFDISSDEEEQPEPVELPAAEAPAKTDALAVQEALPSVFSLYGPPSREFTPPNPQSSSARNSIQQTPPTRNSIQQTPPARNSIQKTPPARSSEEIMKRRMQKKESENSIPEEQAPPEAVSENKRGGESRLAHSRLGTESVLSLSSGSEEEKYRQSVVNESTRGSTVILEKAYPVELQRSSVHIHQLGNQDDASVLPLEPKVRRSYSADEPSTTVSSMLPSGAISPPSSAQRNRSVLSESSVEARRRFSSLRESDRPASSRRLWHSSHGQEGRESTSEDTSSSVPTDASRMMAVTEEEMMLLELMRQKRAAMQQNSFAEGYRLARSEGDQKISSEQSVTQDPALMVVKQKESSHSKQRGQSKTESLIREEVEHRRRLSALRKEDVDRAFKMGRFLAMEAPNGEKTPRMERFLVMAPGLADEFAGRPMSGTEIDIESRYDENEAMGEEMASRFDETDEQQLEAETECDEEDTSSSRYEEDEHQRPERVIDPRQTQQVFSPMQRLTDSVRGLPSESLQVDNGHADDHYAKVRAFLASNRTVGGAGPSALPTPPTDETFEEDEHTPMQPPVLEEEAPPIPVPVRSPHRPSLGRFHTDSQVIDTMSSESHIEGPETPVATSWARPPSLKHPRPHRQPAVLDFAPLEVPSARAVSPSIATSRPSPLTPWTDTFEPSPLSPNTAVESTTAGSDDEYNLRNEPYISETAIPNPLRSHPVTQTTVTRPSKKAPPPKIDTMTMNLKAPERATSMASITSAGEDVLQAWAELGGSDNLAFKRKRNR